MTHKIILATILILLGNQTYSQDSNIKGRTIDYETNYTIIGATIIDANNSQNGTISDRDGNFKIEVEGNKRNLELYFFGYYPIKFINIPKGDKNTDFKEIKLVPNHLLDNTVVGGPPSNLYDFEKQKEQDKRLRKNVLKKYRIKILGEKLNPYFEGKYLVFDFNKNGNK